MLNNARGELLFYKIKKKSWEYLDTIVNWNHWVTEIDADFVRDKIERLLNMKQRKNIELIWVNNVNIFNICIRLLSQTTQSKVLKTLTIESLENKKERNTKSFEDDTQNVKQSDLVSDKIKKNSITTIVDPLIKWIDYVFNKFNNYNNRKLFTFWFSNFSEKVSRSVSIINNIVKRIINNKLDFSDFEILLNEVKREDEKITVASKNPLQKYIEYINTSYNNIFKWKRWITHISKNLFSIKVNTINDFIEFESWIDQLKDKLLLKRKRN